MTDGGAFFPINRGSVTDEVERAEPPDAHPPSALRSPGRNLGRKPAEVRALAQELRGIVS